MTSRILSPYRRRRTALAIAERMLAAALRRITRPAHTVWITRCMTCRRLISRQVCPYEEQHGECVVSHGLCLDCDALDQATKWDAVLSDVEAAQAVKKVVLIDLNDFPEIRGDAARRT